MILYTRPQNPLKNVAFWDSFHQWSLFYHPYPSKIPRKLWKQKSPFPEVAYSPLSTSPSHVNWDQGQGAHDKLPMVGHRSEGFLSAFSPQRLPTSLLMAKCTPRAGSTHKNRAWRDCRKPESQCSQSRKSTADEGKNGIYQPHLCSKHIQCLNKNIPCTLIIPTWLPG